jgi:hypothetical protein
MAAPGSLSSRVEIKYLVHRTARTALERDLAGLMAPDAHGDAGGAYVVRSLYLDTPDYEAYHSKLAGHAVRHKLRARLHGADPSQAASVRLEVKSRFLRDVRKIVVETSREDYLTIEDSIRRRGLPPARILETYPSANEFFRLLKQYNMEPKVVVQYRRRALERRELGRVRVSIDDEIVAARQAHLFGDLRGARRLLNSEHAIVEFKIDGPMPFWLHTLISKHELVDQALSKYCFAVRSEARLSAIARVEE